MSNTAIDKAKFYIERNPNDSRSEFMQICQALVDTEPKTACGLENQIILYAKGWYKYSGNSIEDIRTIIAEACAIDPEHISDGDVKANIIGTFERYVPVHDRIEALMRGLGIKSLFPNQEPNIYEDMLGKLSIIKGHFVDKDKKMDFNFEKEECNSN